MTRTRPHARPAALRGESRLYDLVALGLWAYVHARYRVRVVGAPFVLEEGTLVVSTHRSDDDIPLIAGALYRQAHGLVRRNAQLHFVVRDDLFDPGFFAGYPPRVPRLLRRVLFSVGVGSVLRGWLPCHPIRVATRMRLVQFLRDHPDEPLEALLPPSLLAPLLVRAQRLGRTPRLGRDVLSGDYADLLWRVTEQAELPEGTAEEWWRARRAGAAADFRELVDVLRAGRPLLICPEGRPSPDGTVGPLMSGVAALVRRGAPRSLVPVAPAYDPLVRGRPRAYLGVGEPVAPRSDPDEVLDLLRRTTPLTVGSSLAAALADGADPEARLAADVEEAREQGRPYEPELDDPAVRAGRLAEARRAAGGRDLSRLEREYRSAREPVAA